ncbi:MAG: hypothetical protein JNM84_26885 [Planctomycetes bacterium]|nr:hypothetical protein [Planctomycetota bacterium]
MDVEVEDADQDEQKLQQRASSRELTTEFQILRVELGAIAIIVEHRNAASRAKVLLSGTSLRCSAAVEGDLPSSSRNVPASPRSSSCANRVALRRVPVFELPPSDLRARFPRSAPPRRVHGRCTRRGEAS